MGATLTFLTNSSHVANVYDVKFARLPAEVSDEIKSRLVRAVKRAYDENMPLWRTAVGHDTQTFGLMLFKSIWHYLEIELAGVSGVRCLRTANRFEIHIGPVVIRSYKLGHGEADPVDERYPSNEMAAALMALDNLEQLHLALPEDSEPTNLILGHQGNPITGMTAVYLLVPLANGSSYEWDLIVRIDQPPASASGPDLPQPAPIRPAPLRPRKDLKRGSDADVNG